MKNLRHRINSLVQEIGYMSVRLDELKDKAKHFQLTYLEKSELFDIEEDLPEAEEYLAYLKEQYKEATGREYCYDIKKEKVA